MIAQGRPVGLLVAWLLASFDEAYGDAWSHVHTCFPTHDQRRAARDMVKALPGGDFLTIVCERKHNLEAGEPGEPIESP